MVKFLHQCLFLILFFNLSVPAYSQSGSNHQVNEFKNPSPENAVRLKKQSANSENVIDSKKVDSNQSVSKDSSEHKYKDLQLSIDSTQTNKLLETIPFDYNQMPQDVQIKIDQNKAAGKSALDGIAKAYTVEIKSCSNSESTKNNLAFLNKQNGFIRVVFVSSGIIKIIVQPDFDSVDLKNSMISAGVEFNFLNEYFLINN